MDTNYGVLDDVDFDMTIKGMNDFMTRIRLELLDHNKPQHTVQPICNTLSLLYL
jgi:hypothetical protein